MTIVEDPRLVRLESIISDLGGVAVGLSGGVDSSLLTAAAHRALGPRSVAVIARSPSLPQRELEEALRVAADIGIETHVVDTKELDDPRYAGNPRNRCYFCRDHQFAALRSIADGRGLAHIADGQTVDDLREHRPGQAAAAEWSVKSPLREAGLGKRDVRDLARSLELPVWDKPSFACLASRIPTGSGVTSDRLRAVEAAESLLFTLGFRAFRVRHHGRWARIELPLSDHPTAVRLGGAIASRLSDLGFEYTVLDRRGLQSGPAAWSVEERDLLVLGSRSGGTLEDAW